MIRSDSFGEIARRAFLAWEKMRLLYIAICGAVTLATGMAKGPATLLQGDFWLLAVFYGLFANALYFAGPAVDTYATWLGLRSKTLRWAMFAVGTLFTATMAALLLADVLVPNLQ
ncbi:hypothetical protein K239x_50390 [Planctomycetes bacterium K23_9]|uniref:Uncharacterized protein n=2 Tax=Stieleria marina TaxID=1930275 RepID=A0A517P0X6_9BACT|nr:hypothetical protein K239x_50390 [Planctomycetes bacterium K23_9]